MYVKNQDKEKELTLVRGFLRILLRDHTRSRKFVPRPEKISKFANVPCFSKVPIRSISSFSYNKFDRSLGAMI